jgi:hypothetical protein
MPGPYHPGRRAPDVRGYQLETGLLRKPDWLRLALRTGRNSFGWRQVHASFVDKPGVRPYVTEVTNRHFGNAALPADATVTGGFE